MTGASGILSGSAGPYLAVIAMAAATYLCRVSGVLAMKHLTVTPRIERGLRALPGSIVVATVLPIVVEAGSPAALGLVAGLAVMAGLRFEIAALLAGLGTVAATRWLGL